MEFLRQFLRHRVGYTSWLYRAAAAILTIVTIARREGPTTAWLLSALSRLPAGEPRALIFSNLDHPIFARPGTPDIPTLVNNIVREEYGAFAPSAEPKFMIDAGAYIGDSSAYFASKFPKLNIMALEPHPDNFALAARNLAPYGERVTLFNQALASTEGTLRISGDHDGARVGAEGLAVEATTVPKILSQAGRERVDILKMDIEGFEEEVLDESAQAWLSKVGLLIIEFHDPNVERRVLKMLDQNGFEANRYRSLWYCRRGADA